MNINDDAAEKIRRRKSTKGYGVENALAGPSSEVTPVEQETSWETSKTGRQKQLRIG